MRRYRFLLSARWIGLILGVALLVVLFANMAQWQLGRNTERSGENARIEAGLATPPRPVGDVLAPGRPVRPDGEWRLVTATGRYDAERQLLVRYRHLEGEPGYHVLAPLITTNGTALLVDRGWIPGTGAAARNPEVPAVPPGTVSVTGRVRVGESGAPDQVRPTAGQVRFIDPGKIAESLPYPVYGGFVELTAQQPAAVEPPRVLPEPDLDAGPFLSYGIQWYLFGLIALVGLTILAYDEAHDGKLRERWKRPTAPTDGPAERTH